MHACGFSVYSGHQSILVPPLELESNASLWLAAVSQYKVRVTFCSYSVMEMCTKGLGSQTEALRVSAALSIFLNHSLPVGSEKLPSYVFVLGLLFLFGHYSHFLFFFFST